MEKETQQLTGLATVQTLEGPVTALVWDDMVRAVQLPDGQWILDIDVCGPLTVLLRIEREEERRWREAQASRFDWQDGGGQ